MPPEADLPGGVRVGLGDVERFRVTMEAFKQLDDRFGGGHARQALIQYLSIDGDRLLGGRYTNAASLNLAASCQPVPVTFSSRTSSCPLNVHPTTLEFPGSFRFRAGPGPGRSGLAASEFCG